MTSAPRSSTRTYADYSHVEQKAEDLDIKVAKLSTEFSGFQVSVTKGFIDVNAKIDSFANNVNAAIDSLSRELRERSKPQWQLLIGLGGLMFVLIGGLASIAYTPIKDNESKLELSLDRINSNIQDMAKNTVSVKEFNQYVSYAISKGDDRYSRIVADHNSNMDRIKKLEDDIVPFRENNLHWESQSKVDSDLQRQLDDVRSTVSGIYTPRDAIKRLEDKEQELETLLSALRAQRQGDK